MLSHLIQFALLVSLCLSRNFKTCDQSAVDYFKQQQAVLANQTAIQLVLDTITKDADKQSFLSGIQELIKKDPAEICQRQIVQVSRRATHPKVVLKDDYMNIVNQCLADQESPILPSTCGPTVASDLFSSEWGVPFLSTACYTLTAGWQFTSTYEQCLQKTKTEVPNSCPNCYCFNENKITNNDNTCSSEPNFKKRSISFGCHWDLDRFRKNSIFIRAVNTAVRVLIALISINIETSAEFLNLGSPLPVGAKGQYRKGDIIDMNCSKKRGTYRIVFDTVKQIIYLTPDHYKTFFIFDKKYDTIKPL